MPKALTVDELMRRAETELKGAEEEYPLPKGGHERSSAVRRAQSHLLHVYNYASSIRFRTKNRNNPDAAKLERLADAIGRKLWG